MSVGRFGSSAGTPSLESSDLGTSLLPANLLSRMGRQVLGFFRSHPSGLMGFIIVLAWFVIALAAPFLSPHPPLEIFKDSIRAPPGPEFWFGTDRNGMDVFSRVIHAARLDLWIASTAVSISLVLGVTLGLVTGYIGGWVDWVTLRAMDVLQAFPVLILALAIVAALDQGIASVVLVIAFFDLPIYARLVRGEVLQIREATYVESARAIGNPTWRVLTVHVLPNAVSPVFIQAAQRMAWAVKITASLAFVGVGISVPTPEWGSMIRVGSENLLAGTWWPSIFPGLAVVTLVLGLNLLADALQVHLQPGDR